jgi:heme oxygenase (biliverdin-IX-beta and delta-forming)
MTRETSLHTLLRTRTRASHDGVEEIIRAAGFFSSLQRYRSYLAAMLGFHREAEGRLELLNAHEIVVDFPSRRRATSARADLIALGAEADAVTVPAPPAAAPAIDEPAAEVLGLLYVLEGSTLGGALLVQSIAHLGVSGNHGGTYLTSYGPARGRMWRSFLKTLQEWEQRGLSREHTVLAADAAFRRAASYLTAATARPNQRAG